MKNAQPISGETDTLLTRIELARRHKVSVETLKRRERAGLLKCLKIGRTVRYRLSDILDVEREAAV